MRTQLFAYCDSTALVGSVSNGRSSSRLLLRRLRPLSALLIAFALNLSVVWISSTSNPADGPPGCDQLHHGVSSRPAVVVPARPCTGSQYDWQIRQGYRALLALMRRVRRNDGLTGRARRASKRIHAPPLRKRRQKVCGVQCPLWGAAACHWHQTVIGFSSHTLGSQGWTKLDPRVSWSPMTWPLACGPTCSHRPFGHGHWGHPLV